MFLATVDNFDSIEINVKVKVMLLGRLNSMDSILRKEYDAMFVEKEKYAFLCYCDEANIMAKRVAFLVYKLTEKIDPVVKIESKRKSDYLLETMESASKRIRISEQELYINSN